MWMAQHFIARKVSNAVAPEMLHCGARLVQQSSSVGVVDDRFQRAIVREKEGDAVGDWSPTNALRVVQGRRRAVHFGLRGGSVAGYDDFVEI